MQQTLDQLPVTALKGVGPRIAERLAHLGIHTVQDVLFHLPARYQDRTRIVPIAQCRVGDQVVLQADVVSAQIHFGRRRALLVKIADHSGSLTLRFFHFSSAQKAAFVSGAGLTCYGEVRRGPQSLELVHPEYQLLSQDKEVAVAEALTPIYPTTEGLQQQSWRDLTQKALEKLQAGAGLNELVPDSLQHALPQSAAKILSFSLAQAVTFLHRPPATVALAELESGSQGAQQRLALEELVAHQLSLRKLRQQQQNQAAPSIQTKGTLIERFVQQLPFQLTGAQARVSDVLAADLAQAHPMQRLVQGDVGCGKTVVAALAALRVIEAGYQVAIMAPTELLAEQHFANFTAWLTPLGIPVALLTSRLKGQKRALQLTELATARCALVVGTHALFQDDVVFGQLGLVIIDEQHRFGVHQRLALRDKGKQGRNVPHQLIMTATPIPRTLAMTVYADLDVSIIDELPPGRQVIKTVVVSNQRRDEVIERVADACRAGRQVYWVCTLIEESESLQAQAAEETLVLLRQELPALQIGLVHGRLKAADKESAMQSFKKAELDVLVATTVIEVGVDVPNASLMIIENPERLGLAQLHQLRGRVGRGATASHCVLLYKAPLGEVARERLTVMRETNDGFVIAQKDLEIRGPGEVLGTRQTGEWQLRIADLLRDQALVPLAQSVSDLILTRYPNLVAPLIQRWIGKREQYGQV